MKFILTSPTARGLSNCMYLINYYIHYSSSEKDEYDQIKTSVLNRPGVAEAVLKTPLLPID